MACPNWSQYPPPDAGWQEPRGPGCLAGSAVAALAVLFVSGLWHILAEWLKASW